MKWEKILSQCHVMFDISWPIFILKVNTYGRSGALLVLGQLGANTKPRGAASSNLATWCAAATPCCNLMRECCVMWVPLYSWIANVRLQIKRYQNISRKTQVSRSVFFSKFFHLLLNIGVVFSHYFHEALQCNRDYHERENEKTWDIIVLFGQMF